MNGTPRTTNGDVSHFAHCALAHVAGAQSRPEAAPAGWLRRMRASDTSAERLRPRRDPRSDAKVLSSSSTSIHASSRPRDATAELRSLLDRAARRSA
jgi:hypothetical protein